MFLIISIGVILIVSNVLRYKVERLIFSLAARMSTLNSVLAILSSMILVMPTINFSSSEVIRTSFGLTINSFLTCSLIASCIFCNCLIRVSSVEISKGLVINISAPASYALCSITVVDNDDMNMTGVTDNS